jgi:hypothetical protein
LEAERFHSSAQNEEKEKMEREGEEKEERNAIQAVARRGKSFFEQKKPMDQDAWEYRETDGTTEISVSDKEEGRRTEVEEKENVE